MYLCIPTIVDLLYFQVHVGSSTSLVMGYSNNRDCACVQIILKGIYSWRKNTTFKLYEFNDCFFISLSFTETKETYPGTPVRGGCAGVGELESCAYLTSSFEAQN